MAAAIAWGTLGAATLLVGALIAYHFSPGRRGIALVMALGTGLLIGSVSFELIDAVVVVSALFAGLGHVVLNPDAGLSGALVRAFAGGALLAMLANTLLPEAYEVEGVLTGPLVVLGFAVSLALSAG